MSKKFIYGLVHPLTKELRYVGLSSQGMQTPRRHKKPGSGGKHKTNWVNSLKKQNLMYEIVILLDLGDSATIPELQAAEIRIIAEEKAKGTRLVNETDGGEGTFGYKQSEEQKAAASIMRKAEMATRVKTPAMLEGPYKKKEHRITSGVTEKHCSRCDSWKELHLFGVRKALRDGLQSYCKQCHIDAVNESRPKTVPLSKDQLKLTYTQDSARIKNMKATKAANPQKYATSTVQCFDNGVLVKTFNSLTEAVSSGMAGSMGRLSTVANKGIVYCGYTWTKS